jgi:hypothetical protein
MKATLQRLSDFTIRTRTWGEQMVIACENADAVGKHHRARLLALAATREVRGERIGKTGSVAAAESLREQAGTRRLQASAA